MSFTLYFLKARSNKSIVRYIHATKDISFVLSLLGSPVGLYFTLKDEENLCYALKCSHLMCAGVFVVNGLKQAKPQAWFPILKDQHSDFHTALLSD